MKELNNSFTVEDMTITVDGIGTGSVKAFGLDGLQTRFAVGKVKRSIAVFQINGDKSKMFHKLGREDVLGQVYVIACIMCKSLLKSALKVMTEDGLTEEEVFVMNY